MSKTFIKKAHTELPDTKIIYIGLFPAPSGGKWKTSTTRRRSLTQTAS